MGHCILHPIVMTIPALGISSIVLECCVASMSISYSSCIRRTASRLIRGFVAVGDKSRSSLRCDPGLLLNPDSGYKVPDREAI